MNSKEFKSHWIKSDIDKLNDFNSNQLEGFTLKEITKDFLTNAGLPDTAAPFLDFDKNKDSKIRTITEIFELDSSYNKFLWIGSNNYGDPICIDTQNNDRIIYLNHENNFTIHLVNSSIDKLAEFLIAYRNFINKIQEVRGEDAYLDCNFTDEEFKELETELIRIDEPALDEGTFWNEDLGILLANRT